MTLGKEDSGITRDGHCLQLLLLVSGLGIVDEIELTKPFLYTGFHVEEPLLIHLSVHGRMTSGTLFHELRKHTCMISLLPLFGHMVENALTLGLATPIGNHLTLVSVDIFLRDGVTLQFALVQRMQVLHRVTGQFGECRHSLGLRSALANN